MTAELIVHQDRLAAVAERWDELARADARDGFFRTYGWYRAWMQHIRPDAEPYVIVVRDASGDITGIAPFCRMRYSDLGFRLLRVGWAGRETVSGDFLDFVAAPGRQEQVVSAVLDFLWERKDEWALLMLGELMPGSDSCRAAEEFSRRTRMPFRVQEERICPYIALPASFEEYLESLSSSSRYHIRRRIRDVAKAGAEVQIYSEGHEVAARLGTLSRLHHSRWQKDNQPGTLGRPGFQEFLRDICGNPPAGARCRLFQLEAAGAPCAALLAFHFGQSALYYQAGWDPESPLAASSPGVVLMAASIRDAIENGLSFYEFLRGDEEYKSRWTAHHRTTVTVLLGRSRMAREYLRIARWKDLAKERFGPRFSAEWAVRRLLRNASL
jgi:CelD/BcsL family acetyltransferase involved in cellulose biosynthesis